jgi:predicted AAA+ superfamily ATPase
MRQSYIPQKQLNNLKKLVKPNKVVILYGPRRVGKTTLVKKFLEGIKKSKIYFNGEDIFVQENLSSQSIIKLKDFIGKAKIVIIDEAHKIPNIGLNLKLVVDNIENIKVIATGSASFELVQKIGEPLTGRKFTLKLFPLAQFELSQIENPYETQSNLEKRLIFGSYPEIVLSESNKERILHLKELVNSYLLKDILEINSIKHSDKLIRILRLLAFQIGKEISFSEIASQVSLDKKTVENYLDLLEKVFIIFKLSGFSKNLRKEVSKNKKYYFYDLGIRNAIINNFNLLPLRNDIGSLWENYVISERIKKQEYEMVTVNNYFWRTYERKEIDFIEEREGKLFAYEIKWDKSKILPPDDFINTYPKAKFEVINQVNYLKFILYN